MGGGGTHLPPTNIKPETLGPGLDLCKAVLCLKGSRFYFSDLLGISPNPEVLGMFKGLAKFGLTYRSHGASEPSTCRIRGSLTKVLGRIAAYQYDDRLRRARRNRPLYPPYPPGRRSPRPVTRRPQTSLRQP